MSFDVLMHMGRKPRGTTSAAAQVQPPTPAELPELDNEPEDMEKQAESLTIYEDENELHIADERYAQDAQGGWTLGPDEEAEEDTGENEADEPEEPTNNKSNTNISNAPAFTRDDLMKKVREFGRDSAAGNDSLPRLAMQVVKAADAGLISTEKDPETKLDDAAVIYNEYIAAESKKAALDHSSNGKKANVSKLRQLVVFGKLGNTDNVDPVNVLNRTVDLQKTMLKADEKVLSTYKAFIAVARTQIANSNPADKSASKGELTDEQISSAIRKKAPVEKSVVDELQRIHRLLSELITGDSKAGKDQHEETIAAQEAIARRLQEFTHSGAATAAPQEGNTPAEEGSPEEA